MFRVLGVFGWILLVVTSGRAFAQTTTQVNLAWDASTDPNVVGYIVEYGTSSGVYTKSVDVGPALSYTIKDLTIGKTYYFTVRAYDSARTFSPRSNEIAYTATTNTSCTISFSTAIQTMPAAGGNGSFTLSTPNGCTWTIGSNVTWLTPLAWNGTGTKDIHYTVEPNLSPQPRAAIVYSGPRSVTVTQGGRMKNDLNADGRNDLIWQNRMTGEISVWHMNGTTMLRGEYLTPSNVGDSDWKIVATMDVNKDAQSDIVLQHDRGQVMIWRMQGEKRADAVVLSDSVTSDPRWRIVGAGDMDRDGNDDLIWQHADGTVMVWYMDGYTKHNQAIIAKTEDPRWRVAAVADFNNDGKLDILWRHPAWGQLLVWHMNNRSYVSTGLSVIMANATWEIAGVGDFSGDGKTDLIWWNSVTGELAAWILDNQAIESRALNPGQVTDVNWRVAGPR